ncbi:hypothetical protein QQ045_009962 [Rhodiola kirilowii]
MSDISVQHLARIASDHCPLPITIEDLAPRPSSLKYQSVWHEHPDFLITVKEAWAPQQVQNPLLNFALKLCCLRKKLKVCNRNIFGNIRVQLASLTLCLNQLENDMLNIWSSAFKTEIIAVKHNIADTLRQHYHMLAEKLKPPG